MMEPKKPPVEADATEGEGLSPEQEKTLKTFSVACAKALFAEGGVVDNAVKAIQGAEDVPKALADVAYDITAMIDEKSGGMLDEELMVPAAADVLGQVAEAAQAAKVPIKGREISMATRLMLERYLTENGIKPEMAKGMFESVNGDEIGGSIDRMGQSNMMPAEQPQEPAAAPMEA